MHIWKTSGTLKITLIIPLFSAYQVNIMLKNTPLSCHDNKFVLYIQRLRMTLKKYKSVQEPLLVTHLFTF